MRQREEIQTVRERKRERERERWGVGGGGGGGWVNREAGVHRLCH